ncbi:MAG: helix-turn-helix domain-containing protein [Leptolyngbya sp. SIOISBB]|nr:helix-turn-helix domain-containing protein [Leptolyngbya sp. SIOISBB]
MNPTQQEQLTNVGAYLRDLRTEKGTTIDEVANQIFIRPALVAAIETGDWESLPEPVFVQGFIRRYAEYLGLDGKAVSRKFEPTPVAVLPDPALATSSNVEGVVKQQDKHSLKVLSKAEPIQRNDSATPPVSAPVKWNWILGAVGVAALIGLIIWLTTRNTPQPSTTTDTTTEDISPTDAEAESPSDATSTLEAPAASTPNEAPVEGVTFAINLEEAAWMRVTVDGELAYEGTMPAGSAESWTGDEEIAITAGNSGGILFSFNGSEEQPLGEPGAVSNLTLTPDTELETLSSP